MAVDGEFPSSTAILTSDRGREAVVKIGSRADRALQLTEMKSQNLAEVQRDLPNWRLTRSEHRHLQIGPIRN